MFLTKLQSAEQIDESNFKNNRAQSSKFPYSPKDTDQLPEEEPQDEFTVDLIQIFSMSLTRAGILTKQKNLQAEDRSQLTPLSSLPVLISWP